MAVRALPPIVYDFLKQEEAPVMRVYDDAQPKKILKKGDAIIGTLTAGVGHTGSDLEIGMQVTDKMVTDWLREDLSEARTALYNVIGENIVTELTNCQYAALLSFVFNLGAERKWQIWSVLKAKNFDAVPAEMVKFVYYKGKKSLGLVNRRNAEIALWSKHEPGTHNDPVAPPSSVTRTIPTPPAAAAVAPLHKSPDFIAKCGGLVVSAGTVCMSYVTPITDGVKQIADQISPYADKSDHVGNVYKALVAIVAGLLAVSVVLGWLKHKRDAVAPQDPNAK
jgi:GH24 family phage-related lysozyme (muramidase)